MQPPLMITFHCPSCGMKLQVPEQMAGVTGPCPKCSASIIAPQAAPSQPVSPPAPTAPQVQQPAQQQYAPPQQQQLQQPVTQNPVAPAPQTTQQAPQQQQVPAPEPLQKAAVTSPQQNSPVRPPSSEPVPSGGAPLVNKVHRNNQPPRRPSWMKVVFPLAFLIVAAVLVMVVLQAVGYVDLPGKSEKAPVEKTPPVSDTDRDTEVTETPAPSVPEATPPAAPVSPSPVTPAATPPSSPPPAPVDPVTPAAPVSDPPRPAEGEFPDLSPPPPTDLTSKPATSPPPAAGKSTSPDAKNPPKAGSLVKKPRFKANELLDKFLAAKTLEERLPLMTKSIRSQEDLKASCLAGPLKPVKSNYFSEMVPRMEDDMRQYLYYVSFEDKQAERERFRMIVQLVERPGIHPPRVHADAFIEHYDKLLEVYAQKPSKKITTFHCIAEARTADLVKNLPQEIKAKMIRLVVMSYPGSRKPAFDAFLNKNSPLMERIGARGDLPYVEPRFCVLSFRWNTKNEQYPYIELVDIVTMGWEK